LQIALEREDKPMMQLLITWGASAGAEDLALLQVTAKEKYPSYIKLLRQCGLPLSPAVIAEAERLSADVKAPDRAIISHLWDAPTWIMAVPDEWNLVLKSLQGKGAEEAVIAGGTFIDLMYYGVAEKADIFLKSRGTAEKNREFLKAAFKASGLEITGHLAKFFPESEAPEKFPAPKTAVLSFDGFGAFAENYTVVAGSQKTKYNVIFADKVSQTPLTASEFAASLVNGFDLGMDQIAYNGKELIETPLFKENFRDRRIALSAKALSRTFNDAARERLEFVAKKYKGWKLCEKSRRLLAPSKPLSRWADHHGSIG
jgi:hypothetical protein